ncbi:U-scoloptoxin(01)-Cw1a [Lepeophtheirus salmonis]|uniref:Putative LOC100168286 [Acyrthosiphon pisum] n=1 Tax=Lepeophtheirus salmonis TaxID=72036 RepID=A0A0K2T6M7_LEPSM|nr:U-scoloptoxin(01)-Cw1a-like [Lepeophtheirus salmonis]
MNMIKTSLSLVSVVLALTFSTTSAQRFDIDSLRESIPGEPGQDYPIFSFVPDTSFTCQGNDRVDGGYYADTETNCQAFHICASADEVGFLTKYSFLCPNGTLFNQNYFICDWWFNFDCSVAPSLYSLNDAVAAEREANNPPTVNRRN